MINDPISDMLIRIKNGYMARKPLVVVPHSNVKEALVKQLQKLGYVGEIKRQDDRKAFTVTLKYVEGVPVLTEVKRVSKPGLRRYVRVNDINKLIRGGLGYVLLSTPKGIMTHVEAKASGVGGEVLCSIK